MISQKSSDYSDYKDRLRQQITGPAVFELAEEAGLIEPPGSERDKAARAERAREADMKRC